MFSSPLSPQAKEAGATMEFFRPPLLLTPPPQITRPVPPLPSELTPPSEIASASKSLYFHHREPGFLSVVANASKERGLSLLNYLIQCARSVGAINFDVYLDKRPVFLTPSGVVRIETSPPITPYDFLCILATLLSHQAIKHTDNINQAIRDVEERMRRDWHADIGASFLQEETQKPFRLRAHLHFSDLGIGASIRLLEEEPLNPFQIGLPQHVVTELINTLTSGKGFGLVTGPSGSGKTTALAALLNYVQRTKRKKIVTIEDPIEIRYPESGGQVIQLEVGTHVGSFADGLHSALRQQPHIILIGEIRSAEAMLTCMEAAKTNHLILGTLHSRGLVAVMRRIAQFFPLEQSPMIYQIASESLQFVLSLGLLPSSLQGASPVLAFDYFTVRDDLARRAIAAGYERPQSLIEEMRRPHHVSWAQCLAKLRSSNQITESVYQEARQFIPLLSEKTSS
jgi:twitching motility protein PilT